MEEADLFGASGRLVCRVEVDDDGLALELVQRHGLAVLVLESEIGWHAALAHLHAKPRVAITITTTDACSIHGHAIFQGTGATKTHARTLPQTMAVDVAGRRHRGAVTGGARRPRNVEVEGVQRSGCARARDDDDDDARGARRREGLQQAVAGVNAMARWGRRRQVR